LTVVIGGGFPARHGGAEAVATTTGNQAYAFSLGFDWLTWVFVSGIDAIKIPHNRRYRQMYRHFSRLAMNLFGRYRTKKC